MPVMTQSFEHWLFTYHNDIFAPVAFGHLELITEEMLKEYINWLDTDEGKSYLKGGSNYNPEHRGNIAREVACG